MQLHAVDSGRDLGAWLLRPQHLGKGWVRCWLPEVSAEASHDLEARITWLGDSGSLPAISLGNFGDWHEQRASLQGSPEVLGGCLALSVWTGGVPGTMLKGGPVWCSPQRDGSVEYCLDAQEIASMQLHVPPALGLPADWEPFQLRHDDTFILHPLGDLATTLRLNNGCTPDLDRVTAFVKIGHPLAQSEVMYALAAVEDEGASARMDQPLASDPRILAFSGWHTIARDSAAHAVVMNFDKPLTKPAHLILATRMPTGANNAWAWAEWLEVRLRVRGSQVPAIEPMETTTQRKVA